jgi:hypothetical protein
VTPSENRSLWKGPTLMDDICDGCERSVAPRFPYQEPPDLCESCAADFYRELRAGHVTDWGGNVLRLDEESHVA